MSFCTNCGAPLEEGASFCTYCGTKIIFDDIPVEELITETPAARSVTTNDLSKTPLEYTQSKNNTAGIPLTPVRTTNSWMGILGFILSFFLFTSPAAVVLGILDIVLKKGRRHGLAIAGIVIGAFFTILLVIALLSE